MTRPHLRASGVRLVLTALLSCPGAAALAQSTPPAPPAPPGEAEAPPATEAPPAAAPTEEGAAPTAEDADAAEPAPAADEPPASPAPAEPPLLDATEIAPPPPEPPVTPEPAAPPPAATKIEVPPPSEEEPPQADEPVPWRYSEFSWTQWVSLNSLAEGNQQTYNPNYTWQFSLRPRWYFNADTWLRLRQDFVVELTQSDTTDYAQELVVGDTNLTLSRNLASTEPFEGQSISWRGWLEVDMPTSKASRATETVAVLRARNWLFWNFGRVLDGLMLLNVLNYAYRAATADTAQTDETYPCTSTGAEDSGLCTSTGGYAAVEHWMSATLGAQLTIVGPLSVYGQFMGAWSKAPSFGDATIDTDTDPDVVIPDTSPSKWRNSRSIYLEVSYQVTGWFMTTLYYDNTFSERDPDADLRGPFNPLDSVIGLALTVQSGSGRALLK